MSFNKHQFIQCVNITKNEHGTEIDCVNGLWGVNGPDYFQCMNEAIHYWLQYKSDGEYDELLKPKLRGYSPDLIIMDDVCDSHPIKR